MDMNKIAMIVAMVLIAGALPWLTDHTVKVVVVDGEKVIRTTTVEDEDAADLQAELDRPDAQIDATRKRCIVPLKARRKLLIKKLATLDVIVPQVD
jgi:hypothetical protein